MIKSSDILMTVPAPMSQADAAGAAELILLRGNGVADSALVRGDGVADSALVRGDGVADSALVRGDGVAAWRKIADGLEAEIVEGRLAPGARLPTEAALAARYAVNRHTVRRALAALADKGLLRTAQGLGTFVEMRRIPYAIGPRTRFSENVASSGHAAGAELIEAVPVAADEATARALNLAPGAPVLRIATRRFVDGTPISIARSYLPLPRFAGFAAGMAAAGTITGGLAACGVADYRRIETRIGARAADAAEAAALDLPAGRILLTTDSIEVDGEGVPIAVGRALCSADRMELVVAS